MRVPEATELRKCRMNIYAEDQRSFVRSSDINISRTDPEDRF